MTLTDIAVTTGPTTGSTKENREAPGRDGAQAPFPLANLTGGEHVDPSDTSEPSTDPGAVIDLTRGPAALPPGQPCLSTLDLVGPDERPREELRLK